LALEERRTSVASNFFLGLGLARTPSCNKKKQNKTNQTTQLSVATLARDARARAAIGVRAASTLSCLCSLAAWSKLFDISDMPKSCAEGPGATVRDESRSIKEPAEIDGEGEKAGSKGGKQ